MGSVNESDPLLLVTAINAGSISVVHRRSVRTDSRVGAMVRSRAADPATCRIASCRVVAGAVVVMYATLP